MRILLLLLILIIVGCTKKKKPDCNYITDYYQTIYKADYEFETENYEKAFKLYQDAFNSCNPITTLGYNEIAKFTETTAILENYELTYEFAKKLILNGSELSKFQNNTSFNKFMASQLGQQFIEEYDELRKELVANADLKLRDELITMRIADQMYRGQGRDVDWGVQDSIDKLHEKRLIEIFESIGYPTDKIVGPQTKKYKFDVGLLLLHTKDSIRMNYFVPKVKEFVKKGTASPSVLGSMIDQHYLYNDQPQIYGSRVKQGGGYENMILDLKKVDSNRVSIGLPPLELKQKKDSLNKIKYGF
ncbi:hypothetical protein [uncultured Marixanthomonas sp.]|uniref:hypothetical protein n=1 Tax=uncultured Marixanthomonas sp. TaxID=757245 RepID=UPI0030D7FFA0|tara:strand:+ start:9960 stop:10868 length:909 start_codon:yes stop_codon:yes gene_type:complete